MNRKTCEAWLRHIYGDSVVNEAKRLIDEGYHQISARYRTVSKLEPGWEEVVFKHAARTREQFEKWCKRYGAGLYMRVHAKHVELKPSVFAVFKKLGGPTA